MSRCHFLGEVISNSITGWEMQCWDYEKAPAFGALLVAEHEGTKPHVAGIVTRLETGSFDADRTPTAYQQRESVLKSSHPEIFALLRTKAACTTTGYWESSDNSFVAHLPAHPPAIHCFVREANAIEIGSLLHSPQFLSFLLKPAVEQDADELLFALLRWCQSNGVSLAHHYRPLLDSYAQLVHHEYSRLRQFIIQTHPLLKAALSTAPKDNSCSPL